MRAVQPLQLANLPNGDFYSSYNGVPYSIGGILIFLCTLKCGQFRICELILPLLSILIFPFSLFIYNAGCAKYTIFSVLYNIKHKSLCLSFIFTLLIFFSALSAHCAMHNFTLISFSSVSLTLTDIGGAGCGCFQFLATLMLHLILI